MATSKKSRITGWVLSGLVALFLFFDVLGKLTTPEEVVKGMSDMGYPLHTASTMGVILLISTILFLIPRTAFFGAILLTGFLGGAVSAHLRIDSPLFSHMLFPVYMGIIAWVGLYLRGGLPNLVPQK